MAIQTMNSELCRSIQCPYLYKFCGKAACRFTTPKQFIRHLDKCPATLNPP